MNNISCLFANWLAKLLHIFYQIDTNSNNILNWRCFCYVLSHCSIRPDEIPGFLPPQQWPWRLTILWCSSFTNKIAKIAKNDLCFMDWGSLIPQSLLATRVSNQSQYAGDGVLRLGTWSNGAIWLRLVLSRAGSAVYWCRISILPLIWCKNNPK